MTTQQNDRSRKENEMTDNLTNEAAERLREAFALHGADDWEAGPWRLLDAALSEERRRTVAAIRERLAGVTTVFQDDWQHESGYDTDEVNAILDEIVRPDTDEPDFGRCCGNYLDTGECCAAAYGTANLR